MDYVKNGTLTIQARTIEEVNSIDRVVVYADGCEREYLMPFPVERKLIKENNMELISRDEAIEAIEGICNTPCNQYFINAIKKLPTIGE